MNSIKIIDDMISSQALPIEKYCNVLEHISKQQINQYAIKYIGTNIELDYPKIVMIFMIKNILERKRK